MGLFPMNVGGGGTSIKSDSIIYSFGFRGSSGIDVTCKKGDYLILCSLDGIAPQSSFSCTNATLIQYHSDSTNTGSTAIYQCTANGICHAAISGYQWTGCALRL